jgi:hypothetical protein
MDPIEHMAQLFTADCKNTMTTLANIMEVVQKCATIGHALKLLSRHGIKSPTLEERIPTLGSELQQYQLCVESMDEIKALARKILFVNYSQDEQNIIFNQEVCFSCACKFISTVGPRRTHFSDAASVTVDQIRNAEINIALNSPHGLFVSKDLFCYETM